MKQALAALLALSGCDVVFGLDRPPDGAPPDIVVSGRITERYLHGDGSLALVAQSAPLAQSDAPALRVAGHDVPIGWSASEGLFTFQTAGGEPYRLRYRGTEYQLSATSVKIDLLTSGRPDAIAPDPATVLQIAPTSDVSAGANVYLMSSGIFSLTKPNTRTTRLFDLPWANATFFGTPGLLDTSKGDQAYLLKYVKDPAQNEILDEYVPASVMMAQGQITAGIGPLLAVARSGCVTIEPARIGAEVSRLDALLPGAMTTDATWNVFATARADLGVNFSVTVASGHVTQQTDAPFDIQYGIPFPSFDPLLSYTARQYRTINGTLVEQDLIYYASFPPSSTCAPVPVPTGISVALDPKLAGVAITDDVTIGIAPDTDPVLTFEESPGSIGSLSYRVRIVEVGPPEAPVNRVVYFISSATPRIVIDRELLEPGKRYVLDIFTSDGLDAFASGDVTHVRLPYGAGVVVTPPFKISR